jgi:prepilin-type N-terminal cleavage/methylation domain-containing protein
MHKRETGFTISELVIVLAIIGVVASMGVPQAQRWISDSDASATARSIANAFYIARSDAIRTGTNQIVFLGVAGAGDVAGNPLLDGEGNPVPLLILNDGAPGSANQNCTIDAAETTRTIPAEQGMSWGFALAGGIKAPEDDTAQPIASGSSFARPNGAAASWVLFGPDGTPMAFDAACNTAPVGSGNGAVYFTNGTRDYAVVLNPMGGVRVHSWDVMTGQWRN